MEIILKADRSLFGRIMVMAQACSLLMEEQLPDNCASVVDRMSLVQRVKSNQATFGDIATTVFSMALNEGGKSNRIDIVFDMYHENSIKNSERLLRGEESGHKLQAITGTQIVRWWSFLTRVKNKNSLISFTVREWMKAGFREKLQQKVLYATTSDKCYRITSDGSNEVQALQCQQEEADECLLLHATHAAEEGYKGSI